jgi:hypothetical protein
MRTVQILTLGLSAQQCSSQSSFRWAEPFSSFQQVANETIPEAWERPQEYILACPHHGMDKWLILHSFYNGMTLTARGHIDVATGGAFFSLTIVEATKLIEKMVSNQGWSDTTCKTHFGNGHRWPLVMGKAPVTDQVLQMSQER